MIYTHACAYKGRCISSTGEDHLTCHLSKIRRYFNQNSEAWNWKDRRITIARCHTDVRRDEETDKRDLLDDQSCKIWNMFVSMIKRSRTRCLFIESGITLIRPTSQTDFWKAVSFSISLRRHDRVQFSFLASAVAMRVGLAWVRSTEKRTHSFLPETEGNRGKE